MIQEKGQITISRISSNREDRDNIIQIRINTDETHQCFCEVELTLEQFAMLMTGMGYVNCNLKLTDLDKVGMRRETRRESINLPEELKYFRDKKDVKEYIKQFVPEGWELWDDLCSQSSFVHKDSETIVNFMICRWVNKEENV